MVDKTTNENVKADAFEAVRENFIRTVDEIAKAQPQYLQSISNLQLDYIQTAKNIIQTGISIQKQFAGTWNIPTVAPYADLFVKQASEMTNNVIRSVGINNQLTINTLDATRENLKIYNRTVDAFTDFGTNAAKAWTAFYSQAQQQFTK
jgi:hypothetical protein